ncbi:MAG: xylulokinase [Ilumatobacteraceae bacterium]
MNALAIDLGSTACKASVISPEGDVLGSGLMRLPTTFGEHGLAEQDPEMMWESTLASCRQALDAAGRTAADGVRSICVSSQWMSIVPVDAKGLPVAPLHMWFDRRGEQYTKALTAGDDGEKLKTRWEEVHGFAPSISLSHILWFHHHHDIHRRTAAYLEPMDYLNARFTGRIAATANSAMPFALTDNRQLGATSWSVELVDRAGVDATRLPELTRSLQVLATIRADVAEELGLRRDVEVVTGANDSIASAFGSGAFDVGQGTIMMGTTGVLVAHHPVRHVDRSKFIVTMPSALEDRYYVVAEGGVSGRILETALSQAIGGDRGDGPPPSAFDQALRLAGESTAGSGGVMFLPWLFGSQSPAHDSRHRGAFLGISLNTTSADLARALLEGTSMQMRWLTDEVSAVLDTPFETLRFVGGGAQSDLWASILADVLGRPIEQLQNPRHANARGAGLMAFISTGQLTLEDVATLVPVRARYEPNASVRDLWDERLAVYLDLHAVLAEPVSRLRS